VRGPGSRYREAYLADGVEIIFPGNRAYASLQEMAQASKGRYAWVRKNRTDYSVGERTARTESTEQIVTSIGTFYGEKLDGSTFDGIRYIDVFTLRDGRIVRQEVWNDLAETGIVQASVKTTAKQVKGHTNEVRPHHHQRPGGPA
jgi:ketosteroid isomerase-like protein